jgi:intracellular septation protein A
MSDAESEDSSHKLDLLEEIGGPQGIADSSVPAIVFVAVYTLGGSRISLAGICAVAAGMAIAVLRLVKGESLRFAMAGFIGVAVAAFIASRTGRAEDFFLPGLLLNAVYGAAYLISILVRWPLLGVILGPALGGEGMAWRKDPVELRAYSRASWVWVGVFATRLAVQLPFYLAGSLVALGIARTAMGLPVFALGIWLSYLILKRSGVVTTWRR